MGRDARYVEEADALRYVAGYCLVNDVSERAFQMEHAGTTTKGKSADTFGPTGPWLVTADEAGDPQAMALWTTVNGERRQDGNTGKMIFSVASLIAYVSRFMSLRAGDVISTGTPAGVGHGAKPPRYLQPGDVVGDGDHRARHPAPQDRRVEVARRGHSVRIGLEETALINPDGSPALDNADLVEAAVALVRRRESACFSPSSSVFWRAPAFKNTT